MKTQADKRRSERTFAVGDSVYLKLQPYVQSSLAPRAHQKLSFRYFGPFKVIERIGSVAYKLELPPSSTIHLVFHVSLLKPATSSKYVVSPPSLPDVDHDLPIPEAVLQRRLHPRHDGAVPQVLVKWSGLDASLATWEDEEALRQQFPQAPAWGHAGSQGEGDVTVPHLGQPKDVQLRRSTRARRKSVKTHGPQWTCNRCEAQRE
ncbi:uncharacterized protein [Miscanthus floridulus]|uniref:uncharacterized protein n=1 Tax=Miscanthus floridulus TaxID=154761 RepID=UPI003457E8C7